MYLNDLINYECSRLKLELIMVDLFFFVCLKTLPRREALEIKNISSFLPRNVLNYVSITNYEP